MRCRSILLLIGLSLLAIQLAIRAADAQEAMLQTCLDAAADFSPVYPTTTLPAGTNEVIAVWELGKGENYQELVGTFIAVDVGAAAPANYHIVDARMKLGASRAGRFHFDLPRPMPPGRYRLDVTADGQPWKSADFAIAAAAAPPTAKRLEDILGLADNKVWSYDFTQQAGEGAHLTLPGIEPDAEGKLRARASYTVAGTDSAGTRIEMRRNDRLVLEEWWRLGPTGLAVTQRKAETTTLVLDPPQIIVAWPPGTKAWEWTAKDKSDRQQYKMWGPVPIEAPAGQGDGYVVLMRSEQPNGIVLTIERQFAPGVGMVREQR
jgi:hypothetical protein